jgi:hypothetical protein
LQKIRRKNTTLDRFTQITKLHNNTHQSPHLKLKSGCCGSISANDNMGNHAAQFLVGFAERKFIFHPLSFSDDRIPF